MIVRSRAFRHALLVVAVFSSIGNGRGEPWPGAGEEPKGSPKEETPSHWTDAYILAARTQLRPPNAWRTLQAGVNYFPIHGPHRVELALNLTFIGLNPDKQAIVQPGIGLALTFRRVGFVGWGFSPNSDVHDNGYFFFGFSGLGIKDAIAHAKPGAPATPPAPAPSPSPSAKPSPPPRSPSPSP